MHFFHNMLRNWDVLTIRWSWYRLRKSDGYPISFRRAMTGEYPRLGPYAEGEEGCPEAMNRLYTEMKQWDTK
jgi:hypothetical protein